MARSCSILICGIFGCSLTLICCAPKEHSHETQFTQADSLTDRYLQLQDSVLYAWNTIVNDETHKFRAMHELIDKLMSSANRSKSELVDLEARLDHLINLSLTQEALGNESVVEEYDFTNANLVSELIALAEADPSVENQHDLKKIMDKILAADRRAIQNRALYDAVANRYNKFLVKNTGLVLELNGSRSSTEKPVFEVAAE